MAWQRSYRLCRRLIENGQPLPTAPGQTTVQSEDLGAQVPVSCGGFQQPATGACWLLLTGTAASPVVW